jgi:hypothetical protein
MRSSWTFLLPLRDLKIFIFVYVSENLSNIEKNITQNKKSVVERNNYQ